MQRGELHVYHPVVPFATEVGCGDRDRLRVERAGEESFEDIGADEEVGRTEGAVLGVPQDALIEDGDALAHRSESALGGIEATCLEVVVDDGAHVGLAPEVGDDAGLELAALREEELTEVGTQVIARQRIVADVSLRFAVHLQPVEDGVAQGVVPRR